MSNEMISSADLGKFVDWVWALKQERDGLLHEREGLQSELKRMRALLAKPAGQHQGEPVAVMYADGSVLTKAECGISFDICCKVETPLYTRPAEQPAPVAVVPERLAQILKFLEGAENLDGYWFGEQGSTGQIHWWRAELRKALEETNLFASRQ